jgi:gamma-glutamyltranspeptidase/glutathione hydrolase
MSLPRRCAALLCCVVLLAVPACNPAPPAGTGQAAGKANPSALERRENVSETWRFRSDTSAVSAEHGMVFSDAPQATSVGAEVLRSGGSAVDAAVATAFALAVVWPTAGNIGGGGFALLNVGGEAAALDFREVAPAAARRDMYLDAQG